MAGEGWTSLDLSGGEEGLALCGGGEEPQRCCLGFGVGLGFEKVKDGEFRINGGVLQPS